MTAIERAGEVVRRHFGDHPQVALECSIADAIAAAVAEERAAALRLLRRNLERRDTGGALASNEDAYGGYADAVQDLTDLWGRRDRST